MPYTPGAALSGLGATLGSVALGAVDDAGTAWYLQTLEGWDSPEIRAEYSDREGDHGAWPSPVYLGARPVTLGGTIVAPSRAQLEQAMERLRAAAGLTDTVLTVGEEDPKRTVVRRSGKLLLQYLTDTTAQYSVLVTAADPRRYEAVEQIGQTALPSTTGGLVLPAAPPWTISATTVSGQFDAANRGSVATRPMFTVAGPVQQPTVAVLYEDGAVRSLAYADTLGAGDVLTIDTDAHTVMLGSASRRRYLSGQWPEIPPGESVTITFTAAAYNPSALLTARWRSAWL
ncbi:phage distal tail protein [Streptomyces niveiscabiei]|uniref:phage distal tail protein n=1 Tax=Streptomyces niveiscabiei TaxID=164115 RepID=UPI0006EBC11A|nr:phage tail domain-containing protein [Streptomyces niveiscabiei]